MRLLTEMDGKSDAQRFVAYLITQDLTPTVEPAPNDPNRFEIWIRDEDQLEAARSELTAYRENPKASKYDEAKGKAAELVRLEKRKKAEAAKNLHQVRHADPRRQLNGKIPPVTLVLCFACGIVFLLTGFGSQVPGEPEPEIQSALRFVTPDAFIASNGNPLAQVEAGEVWRLFTPALMHGDLLHIALNLFMLVQLGRIVERSEGSWRFLLYCLAIAGLSNFCQAVTPRSVEFLPGIILGGWNFLGISGVVFGLFGFLWIKSNMQPQMGLRLSSTSVTFLVVYMLLGFVIAEMRLANIAHLVGLLTGIGLAFVSVSIQKQKLSS
jgi:GlpG protein